MLRDGLLHRITPIHDEPVSSWLPPSYENALQEQHRHFCIRRFAGPDIHSSQLESLRIAHLTDLHVGRITPMHIQYEAVRITNATNPDAVVITGDFVCHSQLYLDALHDVIRRFRAPVICVLGNHDHWSGGKEVAWALRKAGAEVLSNANTVITLGHQRLQLVGLDDSYTGQANIHQAVKGLNPRYATLGLSHIAEEADGLWRYGVPLVLSGHTHAGQITVARLHEIAIGRLAGHRYIHGLYGQRDLNQGAVYVSAGIGSAVLPIRIGQRAKREITLFELGHRPGSFVEPIAEQLAYPAGRAPSMRTQYRRAMTVLRKELRRQKRKR